MCKRHSIEHPRHQAYQLNRPIQADEVVHQDDLVNKDDNNEYEEEEEEDDEEYED